MNPAKNNVAARMRKPLVKRAVTHKQALNSANALIQILGETACELIESGGRDLLEWRVRPMQEHSKTLQSYVKGQEVAK